MATIDLDLARKERANKENATVVFKSKRFTLPKELPFKILRQLNKVDEIEAMEIVIGELLGDKAEEFYELDPSIEDVGELVDGAMKSMRKKVVDSEDSQDS